jgi:iron complex outermembrane receptor protein
VSQRTAPGGAPANGANVSSAGNATTNRQFAGIVGASTSVITSDDIAHSPAQSVQEIIAQTPGVQLTSLFGGVKASGPR